MSNRPPKTFGMAHLEQPAVIEQVQLPHLNVTAYVKTPSAFQVLLFLESDEGSDRSNALIPLLRSCLCDASGTLTIREDDPNGDEKLSKGMSGPTFRVLSVFIRKVIDGLTETAETGGAGNSEGEDSSVTPSS